MSIQVFSFDQGIEVRVIIGPDNEPWWVAADVCRSMALGNVSQATARVDEEDRGISSVDTPSGQQEMLTVNESGLYSLILSCRKPEAKAFKRWVTSEVLPTIRKTGRYQVPTATPTPVHVPPAVDEEDPILAMLDAIEVQGQRSQDLIRAHRQQRLATLEVRRRVDALEVAAGETRAAVEQSNTLVAAALAAVNGAAGHFTVRGYCAWKGITLSDPDAVRWGKALASECREKGLPIEKVADKRHGFVNAYPVKLMDDFPWEPRKQITAN